MSTVNQKIAFQEIPGVVAILFYGHSGNNIITGNIHHFSYTEYFVSLINKNNINLHSKSLNFWVVAQFSQLFNGKFRFFIETNIGSN